MAIVLVGYKQSETNLITSVSLCSLQDKKINEWKVEGRGAGTGRDGACVMALRWLLARKVGDTYPTLVGFEVAAFLEWLQFECALPGNREPVPRALWQRADTIEMTSLCQDLPRQEIVARFQTPTAAAFWKRQAEIPHTHTDAKEDLALLAELASAFGLLRDLG